MVKSLLVWRCEHDPPDVVLRGQGLKDGDGEGHSVCRLMHHLLRQQPGLRVVDVLILGVLHPDVPPHAIAVRPVLPLKRCLNPQLHPEHCPAPMLQSVGTDSFAGVCIPSPGCYCTKLLRVLSWD